MTAAAVEFDGSRWTELAHLLSLDVVRPFFPLMGLGWLSPERLQRAVRTEILASRKRWASAVERGPTLTPEGMAAALLAELGANEGDAVLWWARSVFPWDPRGNKTLTDWEDLLEIANLDPDQWARLFPGDLAEQARSQYKKSRSRAAYNQLQDQVDAGVLSDWDLHIYTLRLYDDNLYLDRVPTAVQDGPRLYVPTAIKHYQAYQLFKWVRQTLPPDQLEQLWQAGKQVVIEDQLTWIDDLAHPSALESRL